MIYIMKFDYKDNFNLTKNISLRELICPDKTDTKVNLIFIKDVQKFMDNNSFEKIRISSGYRSPSYNKKICGSKNSEHCKGNAIDCCFYKNGKIVPAKQVCCLAQDHGFRGIGYIDKNYVHLDCSEIRVWRGDESKHKNFKNFYTYFNISNPNAYLYSGQFPVLPKRGYFVKNDKSVQVEFLQYLLNWLNDAKLKIDGIIGRKTINEVKTFQKNYGLKVDGYFGKASLKKAKEVRK